MGTYCENCNLSCKEKDDEIKVINEIEIPEKQTKKVSFSSSDSNSKKFIKKKAFSDSLFSLFDGQEKVKKSSLKSPKKKKKEKKINVKQISNHKIYF